jgi:hypothetical protein
MKSVYCAVRTGPLNKTVCNLEEPTAETVAGLQASSSESRGQSPPEVGDQTAQRVEEVQMEQDTRIPKSLTPIAVRMTKLVMRISTPSPLFTPGGTAPSDSKKAEALVDSLKVQFQPVTATSVPAVIQLVDTQLEPYFQTSTSEPMLTDTDEVQNAIRDLKLGKSPDPNDNPNRALNHFPMGAVLLLVHIFNAILHIHHFTPAWKHIRLISILKPGKDPSQPISLLDTIGKLFEKILLTRILHQVGVCGLLRD